MKIIRKVVKIFVFLIGFLLVGTLSIYGYSKLSPKLEIEKANNIIFYDSSNSVFFEGNNDSQWITLENISENIINATISTEDKRFYECKKLLKTGA